MGIGLSVTRKPNAPDYFIPNPIIGFNVIRSPERKRETGLVIVKGTNEGGKEVSTGISINKSSGFVFKAHNLRHVLDIIEAEIGKTKNPLFGRVNLEGLQIRMESRILAIFEEGT